MDIGFGDVISFIAGLLTGICIKIVFDWSKNKKTTITQKNNVVGGDMAGRDMTKRR